MPVDTPAGRGPSVRADLIAVGVIAAVCCGALCTYWFGSVVAAPEPPGAATAAPLLTSMYDPPTDAIENGLVKGDGQLFAGQAADPLAQRPEMVRGGPAEQAYRYQRPLYGWLGWVASAGRRGAVAWALVSLTVLSSVLLVVLSARWLAGRGAEPRWALAALALPGVFVDLTWVGPETLGAALVVAGLSRWPPPVADPVGPEADREAGREAGPGHVPNAGPDPEVGTGSGTAPGTAPGTPSGPDWPAVACFAAAGMCRETLLLVPLVLMGCAAARGQRRRAVAAASAAVPYVAWVLFLRVRIGAWPAGSVGGRVSPVPFGGLLDATSTWGPADQVFAAGVLALAAAALVVGRASGLRPVLAAHLVLAAVLGEPVWHRFADFGRVLLPLEVLSLLAVLPALARRRRVNAEARAVRPVAVSRRARRREDAGAGRA
jgi:hypothetical protein